MLFGSDMVGISVVEMNGMHFGSQLRATDGAVQTAGMRLHEFSPTEIVSCAAGREGEPKASGEEETARRRRETRARASEAFGSRETSNRRRATTGSREKGRHAQI
jgi:hypothetical protein